MTGSWPLLAGAVAAAVALLLALLLVKASPSRLVRENVAGRPVPAVLGYAFVAALAGGALPVAAAAGGDVVPVAGATAGVAAVLLVVGALDDLLGDAARGIGGHLRSLARGRPTTGILKLVAGVAAAVVVALHLADEPVTIAAIALLVATSTNLWNALDVVPGRALKWAVVVLVPVVVVAWERPSGPVLAAGLGTVLALLPFDLRERGMLGDGGSNPLGFVVGLGLAVVLPPPAVVGAAAAALLLQVAAETVTISRLIDALPPVRWFDRLGRRPQASRRT